MKSSQTTTCSIVKQPPCYQLKSVRRSLSRFHFFVAKLRQTQLAFLFSHCPNSNYPSVHQSSWARELSITLCALKQNAATRPNASAGVAALLCRETVVSSFFFAESALQPTLPLLRLWPLGRWQVGNGVRCRVSKRNGSSSTAWWLNWWCASSHVIITIFWNRPLIPAWSICILIAVRIAVLISIGSESIGWHGWVVTIWLLCRRSPLHRAILTARIGAVRPRSRAVGPICHACVHRILRVLVAVRVWPLSAVHHRLGCHARGGVSSRWTAGSRSVAVSLATVVATAVHGRVSVGTHGPIVACTQTVGQRLALLWERILTTIRTVPPAATVLGALFV